jgi:hypothetical protein
MTARELIALLEKFDLDLEVKLSFDDEIEGTKDWDVVGAQRQAPATCKRYIELIIESA